MFVTKANVLFYDKSDKSIQEIKEKYNVSKFDGLCENCSFKSSEHILIESNEKDCLFLVCPNSYIVDISDHLMILNKEDFEKSFFNIDTLNVDHLDLNVFREKGYLQEVNRRFFHPLGVALELFICNDDVVFLRVQDYRKDPEGVIYDLKNSDVERKQRFLKNKKYIDKEIEKRRFVREKLFGSIIEPIPEI